MELIIVNENFKKLIGLLINANIKFYTGKFRENYHVVGYREHTSGVKRLWEVDDGPKNLYFYDFANGCGTFNLSLEEIFNYICIIEKTYNMLYDT